MLLRIHKAIDSPWLGINLDTGNWPDEPYAGIAKLAPKASIVQAKTYHGGGVWYTLEIDYKRMADILRKAGYHGYISLEMEGNEAADTAVPKSLALLSRRSPSRLWRNRLLTRAARRCVRAGPEACGTARMRGMATDYSSFRAALLAASIRA